MAMNLCVLLALPVEQRLELAKALWESAARADLEILAKQLVERVKLTDGAAAHAACDAARNSSTVDV